jgi:hypothetical protein
MAKQIYWAQLNKTRSLQGAALSRKALATRRNVAIHKPLIDQRFLDCRASLAMTKRTDADLT